MEYEQIFKDHAELCLRRNPMLSMPAVAAPKSYAKFANHVGVDELRTCMHIVKTGQPNIYKYI